jgi:hypothetical protein
LPDQELDVVVVNLPLFRSWPPGTHRIPAWRAKDVTLLTSPAM